MSIIAQLRSFRLFDISLFDLIASIIGIYLLLKLLIKNKPRHYYIAWTIVLVLPISVISHVVFKTPTTLNYYLGLSGKPVR